ncbi:MAG: putative CopG family antitoxin [Motiliproteus sp.]|jgi:predicted CopG family antitoxin
MIKLLKEKPHGSSSFSEFMRSASSRDKKRVYTKVLAKATERQQAVINYAAKLA